MKNICAIILFACCAVFLFSCEKYEPYPKTVPVTTVVDTTNWQDQYNDGGTLPDNTYTNPLVGTTWVLWKYYNGYAYTNCSDTIVFVTNTTYTTTCGAGGMGAQRTYSLSNITGSTNLALQLNFYCPFGGSNYCGTVGQFFVQDGFMNNIEFSDMQNSTIHIKAWFTKQ